MERANISEIARKLNLSKTTVSRVFNNTPNSRISLATRDKVLSTIREMGYEPNLSARALAKARTHVIGVMFINISSTFVNAFVGTVEELTRERGYHVLLCNSRGTPEREKADCRMLRQRGVEGLIIEHVGSGEHLREMWSKHYPVVLTGLCKDAPEVDFVGFDEPGGAAMATRALLDIGRRRIAYIEGPGEAGAAEDRRRGYLNALAEAGAAAKSERIVTARRHEDTAAGREAAERLLALAERPDGIFCHDDLLAVGAMQAVQAAGLRVPQDIAIIGYGNNYNTPWAQIPLPSVQLDTATLGREACRVLLEKIEKGPEAGKQQIKIKPYLVRTELLGIVRK